MFLMRFYLQCFLVLIFIENSFVLTTFYGTQVAAHVQAQFKLEINLGFEISAYLQASQQLAAVFEQLKSGNLLEEGIGTELVDVLFDTVREIIVKIGLDPLVLPQFHIPFIFVSLNVSTGGLKGLSTFRREGNVSVKVEDGVLNVKAGAGFEAIWFEYHYGVLLRGRQGPSGNMTLKSVGNKVMFAFSVDLLKFQIKLESFKISIGKISLKFAGISSRLVNLFSDYLVPFFGPIIDIILENMINMGLQLVIVTYNQVVCSVFIYCN